MAEQFRTPWLSDVVDLIKRDSTNRIMVGNKEFVQVVRCKDCIHYIRNIPCVGGSYNGCEMIEGRDGNEYEINNESFYCEYGERKEDAEEE